MNFPRIVFASLFLIFVFANFSFAQTSPTEPAPDESKKQIEIQAYKLLEEALGNLAAADYGKTVNLIDQFQRPDVRTFAKLLLVQSIIKGKITLEGNRVNNVIFNF